MSLKPRVSWLAVTAGLLIVVGLPVVAHLVRESRQQGCTLDGARIDPVYEVYVVDELGNGHRFCCLRCAQIWIRHRPVAPQSIFVTDEATGQSTSASAAWFVRSSLVTTQATGNDIHAFRTRADADKHAAAFWGTVLSDAELPFGLAKGNKPAPRE